MQKLEVCAQLKPWSKEIEIALIQRGDDYYFQAAPIVMEKREAGRIISPAFTLKPNQVQQLLDDLWRCGYRPSDGEGSSGQLASVKYHLEDMRKLVFKPC